jgi:hypothetical protein
VGSQNENLRKEQRSGRETREEVLEEIRSGPTQPRIEHANRDRARGDWDRTGDHHDEGASRADEEGE